MSKKQNPVIMTEEDYNLVKPLVDNLPDKDERMSLAYEINRAVIVKKRCLPRPYGPAQLQSCRPRPGNRQGY